MFPGEKKNKPSPGQQLFLFSLQAAREEPTNSFAEKVNEPSGFIIHVQPDRKCFINQELLGFILLWEMAYQAGVIAVIPKCQGRRGCCVRSTQNSCSTPKQREAAWAKSDGHGKTEDDLRRKRKECHFEGVTLQCLKHLRPCGFCQLFL